MSNPFSDLIRRISGKATVADAADGDPGLQLLIASVLAAAARADGGISSEEAIRMQEMLRERFPMGKVEALKLLARAVDELHDSDDLPALFDTLNSRLRLSQKEEVAFMILEVIAADNVRDAQEMSFLWAAIEGLNIPDQVMRRAYTRYFDG